MALGVTFAAPESDRFNYREPEVQAKINVALGGRAAEEVVFGETSTGAESDIQQLTEIARQMVGRWGMSAAIGPVAVIPRDGAGPFLPGAAEVSPDTQRLVDEEVRRIVDESHQQVVALLRQNRSKLDSLAAALLEHETLDEEDAYAAAGVPRAAAPSADSYSAAARQVHLARFLFGRPLGCRESLEALVRNRLAALDREAVRAGRKTRLRTLDGGELFPQIVCKTLVELVLVEIGSLVGRIFLVRRLAGVLVHEPCERPLDPLAFSGQQFAGPVRIHQATLPSAWCR